MTQWYESRAHSWSSVIAHVCARGSWSSFLDSSSLLFYATVNKLPSNAQQWCFMCQGKLRKHHRFGNAWVETQKERQYPQLVLTIWRKGDELKQSCEAEKSVCQQNTAIKELHQYQTKTNTCVVFIIALDLCQQLKICFVDSIFHTLSSPPRIAHLK